MFLYILIVFPTVVTHSKCLNQKNFVLIRVHHYRKFLIAILAFDTVCTVEPGIRLLSHTVTSFMKPSFTSAALHDIRLPLTYHTKSTTCTVPLIKAVNKLGKDMVF
jgi:hypothetical protein